MNQGQQISNPRTGQLMTLVSEPQYQRLCKVLGREDLAQNPRYSDFAKRFPKDDRAAQLLNQLASGVTDKGKQADLYKRIQNDFPDSPLSMRVAALNMLMQRQPVLGLTRH